jgi:hypothetical protein
MKMRGKMSAADMVEKLKEIANKFPDRVSAALYQEAQIEVTEMKRRTPVDTTDNAPHPGNLRNSLHAEEPVREGRRISVTVATGAQAPYGIWVHENPDAFHPIGQWKFMESVLNESRAYIAARIAARLRMGA